MISILCLVNLTANSAYSSIAPFYPKQAIEKGVPNSAIGLIFSAYSIAMCLFAPFYDQMLNKLGAKSVLLIGCISQGISMLLFGPLVYVEDAGWFTVFSIVSRFILGFGNGCLNCSSSSIITTNYRNNMSSLIGLTQSFVGIGMLCGPIIGSLLYEAGGFVLPFFVTGGLLLFMVIPIAFLLP